MLKRKAFPVLIAFLLIAGCSYFNPEDLNLLIDQSRGSLTLSGVSISPTAITTNGGAQEITLSCSVESDFPVNSVTADLSSVGQGKIKLNPSSDKKNWSIKFIVTPSALGNFSFKVTAVNQKEKTAEGAVSLTVTTLSLSAVYVSPSGNDANPGSQDFPFKTLGHAVTYATALGMTNIYMAGGTYIEANTAYSCAVALVGLTNLTIQGGWNSGFTARSVETYPTVIDGNHVQPTVMVIKNTTNVVLDGIVLKNGKPDSALTSFITFRGGGLYAEQANFNFINSEISGNESVYGGGGYAVGVSGVFSNSVISNNYAINAYSGMSIFRSPVRMEYCMISGNNGDGMCIIDCTNFVFQNNIILSNNGDGAVFSNVASIYSLSSNKFIDNMNNGIKLSVADILTTSNRIDHNGCGICVISNLYQPIKENIFSSNHSQSIEIYNNVQNINLINNLFVWNTTAVYITNSIGIMISNNCFTNNIGSSYGPIQIWVTSNVVVRDNTILYNSTSGLPWEYMNSSGVAILSCTNVRIYNNVIVSNINGTDKFGGGGISLFYSSCVSISNNQIQWNNGKNGGGISVFNCDFIIEENHIDYNISDGGYGSSTYGYYNLGGGGIGLFGSNTNTNKIIRNNSISYNTLTSSYSWGLARGGSGIYVGSERTSIISNVFYENSTIDYVATNVLIYIPGFCYGCKLMTNVITGSNQSNLYGIIAVDMSVSVMDANVFATNRLAYLFQNPWTVVTNDMTWTNINSTNYTHLSAPPAVLNLATNL